MTSETRPPSGDSEGHRFLNQERVERVAELIAPLLEEDLSWIERRKDSVTVLDDTALRRQISVDFSLRSATSPLLKARPQDALQALYCAPVFVLPKSSGNLMAFDLEDEDGHSLTLTSRVDNARIAGAALVRMAENCLGALGRSLSNELGNQLRELAQSEPAQAKLVADRLRLGRRTTFSDELALLRGDPRFCWWLSTFAHSSIVVVLFRSAGPRRKMAKLSFEEPIVADQPWAARLGWAPYRVAVDSPLIEARSYHFEAQAPQGLRVTEARLTDDEAPGAREQKGFLKRVHLYRPDAQAAGAGTAVLWLAVSGAGFIGGAVIASFLAVAALVACALSAPSIAANPTSAPALLIALPGLIASYVARPDQHPLTTRLLSSARRLLLISAFCAYVAAAKVALNGPTPKDQPAIDARADSLLAWLIPLSVVAAVCFFGLAITRARARSRPSGPDSKRRFEDRRFMPTAPDLLFEHLLKRASPALAAGKDNVESQDSEERRVLFSKVAFHGARFIAVAVEDVDGDSVISTAVDYVSVLPDNPVDRYLLRREAKLVTDRLNRLEDWVRAGE